MKHLALILTLAAAPAWAQYKCTGADGRVAYQQNPCPTTTRSARLELPTPAPEDGRATFRAAAARGDLMVGMNWSEVNLAVGSPGKCNTSVSQIGRSEQCVWRDRNGATYVYLLNGIVDSVHDAPRSK